MSRPAAEVYNVPYPNYGIEAAPNAPGNMGADAFYGAPGMEWYPRGADDGDDAASYVGYGVPPKSHGHITLKSFDFISMQYMTPPTSDRANLLIKRGMPCFAIREFDKEDNSQLIYPHFMLNQLSKDQWNDFVRDTTGPNADPERVQFLEWMQKYGDDELCAFAAAYTSGQMGRYENRDTAELKLFMDRAVQDGYCYLTKYGWTQKVNWHGANINTNLGAGLESVDVTQTREHYVQANQGLAKRIQMGQCFGTAHEVTMGSLLWIVLRRHPCGDGKCGAFLLYPCASNRERYPTNARYVDEKGKIVPAIVYKVGSVLEPADRNPQRSIQQAANNTSLYGSVDDAYESFGELPEFYVNMGFSQ